MTGWDVIVVIFIVATFPIWIGPVIYLGAMAFAFAMFICAIAVGTIAIIGMVVAAPFVWALRLCGWQPHCRTEVRIKRKEFKQ